MSNQFYVGQQEQCIDAKVGHEQYIEISEGGVYQIRWIGMFNHYVHGDYLGVRLVGIDRGECKHFGYSDTPYMATRFRPLVNDRLGSLRALLVPGQPLAPSVEEPRRQADVKEKEDV